MGAGGVPNRAVENVYGRRGDLPTHVSKPNSRYDLYVDDVRVQSRWFDEKGDVIRNMDYDHQDAHSTHFFPHDHTWKRISGKAVRSKEALTPDYKNFY